MRPHPPAHEPAPHALAPRGAWPALPSELRQRAISADHRDYPRVRSTYTAVGSPQLVVLARDEEEVTATLVYAAHVRATTGVRVPFSVRSGGHGMSGASTNTGGIVLDLSRMDEVEVLDPAAGLVRAQAGARWGQVARALAPHDLVITSGNFGGTGVGGLATAGGVGYFARSQGLTLDRVSAARTLTADGVVHRVDAKREPELFWAVRGGGSQVGVSTEFTFTAARLHSPEHDASIIFHTSQYQVADLAGFTARWGEWVAAAPRELTSFLMVQPAGPGRALVQALNAWAGTQSARVLPVIREGLSLDHVLASHASLVRYPDVVPTSGEPHQGQQQIRMRNVLVERADEQVGAAVADVLAHPGTALVELRSLGGAVGDVPTEATAWAGRHQQALVAAWLHPDGPEQLAQAFSPLHGVGTGTYGAYSADTSAQAATRTWPGSTGERLLAIAEHVDPLGLFDRGLTLRSHQG